MPFSKIILARFLSLLTTKLHSRYVKETESESFGSLKSEPDILPPTPQSCCCINTKCEAGQTATANF